MSAMKLPGVRNLAKSVSLFALSMLFIHNALVACDLGTSTWAYMPASFQNTNKSDPLYFDITAANYANVTHAIYSTAEFLAPDYTLTYTGGMER